MEDGRLLKYVVLKFFLFFFIYEYFGYSIEKWRERKNGKEEYTCQIGTAKTTDYLCNTVSLNRHEEVKIFAVVIYLTKKIKIQYINK